MFEYFYYENKLIVRPNIYFYKKKKLHKIFSNLKSILNLKITLCKIKHIKIYLKLG